MSKVCRTCLQIITPNAPAYHLDTGEPNSATIKNKLADCVPELRLDMVTDSVLCSACVAALNSTYEFKKLCLNTEDTIYGFLSENGRDSVKDLNEVIYKKSKLGCTNVNLIVSVVQNGNDVYQSGLNGSADNVVYGVIADVKDILGGNSNIISVNIKIRVNKDICIDIEGTAVGSSNCEITNIGLELDRKEEIITNDRALTSETTTDEKVHENNGQIIVHQSEPKQSSVHSYKCKFCDYSTNKKHLIKLHLQTHIFKCIWCNYRTTKRSLFLTHIKFHFGKKSLKCKRGNYCSIFAHNLRRHLKAHNGGKPYKWKLGPSNGSDFKHNEERGTKLFNCTLCSYSATKGILLSKHMMNHTREMQFKCDSCGCAFTNRRMLVDHLRIHMSQRCEKM